jgi:hypothetical protein
LFECRLCHELCCVGAAVVGLIGVALHRSTHLFRFGPDAPTPLNLIPLLF